MSDYTGKVVLITGAASGIGRASAIQFAKNGASVAIADMNEKGLSDTAKLINSDALCIAVDVADEDSCKAMINKAAKHFGRIDVLFNNAGYGGVPGYTLDQPTDLWHKVIGVNLNSVFYCSKAVIPELLKVGGGVIINTASVDGLVGMGGVAPYTAAKHGVVGLTKAIALEYGPQNIRCVAIAPGFVETPMTGDSFSKEQADALIGQIPLKRVAQPDDIANLAIWLGSDAASYITGSCHTIDAGLIAGMCL